MKEKKKTAKKKERCKVVCDIIKISDIEYRVIRWKENLYLESRQEFQDGCKDIWVQVEDLTDLRVYEYNALVDELNKHYPAYPLERLESRFV